MTDTTSMTSSLIQSFQTRQDRLLHNMSVDGFNSLIDDVYLALLDSTDPDERRKLWQIADWAREGKMRMTDV